MENYVKNNLSWKAILAMPPNWLSFCLSAATYNVRPSPSNLLLWHLSEKKDHYTLAHMHLWMVFLIKVTQNKKNCLLNE